MSSTRPGKRTGTTERKGSVMATVEQEEVAARALEEAFGELTAEQQEAYRRGVRTWMKDEDPERLPGETRATHFLRCRDAKADYTEACEIQAIESFARATREDAKMTGFFDAMNEGSRKNLEAAAIRDQVKADAEEARQAAADKIRRLESGGKHPNDAPLRS